MPRPIFDIEQYELRGVKPNVFTQQQNKDLNRALGRAHGQIDWTAQLLGYNGPNYWGTSGFKADGTFTWNGLPETMVEKRQMQATTYGVYAKDKSYEYWPAPFNRSKILASGDATFHMFERDGYTVVSPYGVSELTDFSYDPTIFVGGAYIFDSEIEFFNPNRTEELLKYETFSEGDLLWTRLYVLDVIVNDVGVRRKGSDAEPFYFKVERWKDISDWNVKSVTAQFLGAWGNKGASISLDAQFDALQLHGFDERLHLEDLGNNTETYTLEDLFASIGAKTTPWSAYYNKNLAFRINGSNIFYPIPQDEEESIDFFDFEDCDVKVSCKQLIEEDVTADVDCCEVDNVLYDRLNGAYRGPSVVNNEEYDIFNPIIPEQCVNAVDNGWTLSGAPDPSTEYCDFIEGDIDDTRPKGIGSFVFEVEPKNDCATEKLCLEWIFDSELDCGSYDSIYSYPGTELPEANCCLADNEETPPSYLGPNVADSSEFTGELVDGDAVACERALVGGDYPETYTCDPDAEDSKMDSDIMPVMGPWITFDDGEYDNDPYPNESMGTESLCLKDGGYNFDDGIYDEPRQPNCDVPEFCPVLDGDEIWTYAYFPDYDDCVCATECCLIDNFPYLDSLAYQGPDIVDGGVREIECCITDNGIIGPGPFEGSFDAAPDYTDCGPNSGVNPWYCCDALDNEIYEFGVKPYYGPNHVDNCIMESRLVRIDKKFETLADLVGAIKRDYDWPPELTDNGVLYQDDYSIDNEDPDCLPYYCHLDNDKYGDQFPTYDYTIDDCTMTQPSVIEECDHPDPPLPPVRLPPLEDIFTPVYETPIVDCKSCWSECVSCDEIGELCPIDTVFVKVPLLKKETLFKMHPGLENAFTPLRMWKPPTLNVTDEVRNHDTDRYNFLIADDNRGANPEDAYRSFVRLPLEYARGGREWTKAQTVCENMLYWSAKTSPIESVEGSDARQFVYEDCVNKDIPDNSIVYFEDYIHSGIKQDESESGLLDGFTEGGITYESDSKGAFTTFSVVDYDALDLRQPTRDGEWRGNYYRFTSKRDTRLSGHVSKDLTDNVLEVVPYKELPTHDMSEVKHLKSHFPDEDDQLGMKNFVVSYAYFAADFSAGDEPVFDPNQDYCHRDPVRTCSTVDRNGECIPTTYRNKSNYLLHPVA